LITKQKETIDVNKNMSNPNMTFNRTLSTK